MINPEDIIRTQSSLLSTCVEMRMSLEDFIEVADSRKWLVQSFSVFDEICVFASDGITLRASWTYEPNGQSKAIYWSRVYD